MDEIKVSKVNLFSCDKFILLKDWNIIPHVQKVILQIDSNTKKFNCKFSQVLNRAGDVETFVYEVKNIEVTVARYQSSDETSLEIHLGDLVSLDT